jgi:hypothetical protein
VSPAIGVVEFGPNGERRERPLSIAKQGVSDRRGNKVFVDAAQPADEARIVRDLNLGLPTVIRMTVFRPQPGCFAQRSPFRRTAIPRPIQVRAGAGIRSNVVPSEHNLVEVALDFGPPELLLQGPSYVLRRDNPSIRVWANPCRIGEVLFNNSASPIQQGPGTSPGRTVWVEWVNPIYNRDAEATLTFEARNRQNNALMAHDSVRFHILNSVVIMIGGRNQLPQDPPNPEVGVSVIARELYAVDGYDVQMFAEAEQTKRRLHAVFGNPPVRPDPSDPNAGAGPAFDAVVDAVNNRGVTSIALVGYSWGGGAVFNLASRLVLVGVGGQFLPVAIVRPFRVGFTAYIDAIQHNQGLPQAETRRPFASQFHANYFEQFAAPEDAGGSDVHGSPVPGSNFELNVNRVPWGRNLNHYSIDDDLGGDEIEDLGIAGRRVLEGIRSQLVARVGR